MSLKPLFIISLIVFLLFSSGCSDDEEILNEVIHTEIFDTPVGAGSSSAAAPGDTYSFSFTALPGQKLSFASMYLRSNDLFFTPIEKGIHLFNEENEAVSGDITNRIILVDAGTEVNQVIGSGADQAHQQSSANSGGLDSDPLIRLYDGNDQTETDRLIRVTLINDGDINFTLNIQVLTGATTSLSPGIFVVFTGDNPIFSLGTVDRQQGLETLAEDGDPTELEAHLTP